MPRIPIFRLGPAAEQLEPPKLGSYTPSLSLKGLQVGVDNLRHDVHLSPRFVEQARAQIARLIIRHGDVEGLLAAESPSRPEVSRFVRTNPQAVSRHDAELSEIKPLLTEIHVSSLNHAKAAGNLAVDLLGRVAIIKFIRVELNAQFANMLERCRMMVKSYEGVRQQKALEYRERVAAFQVAKKIILRKAGQDLFRTLREIEKETLGRTRRSLFGNQGEEEYKLLLNPLIFTEDGRDTYLTAEHYVMLGNFDRDPDRFLNIRRIACTFLKSLLPGSKESALDGWLSMPENAQVLVGGGSPDQSTPDGRGQAARLTAWVDLLEREGVMEYIVASYEVVPLLAEYSPRINPQQLKNGLITRDERQRLEDLIEQHGKLSKTAFYAAVARISNQRAGERARIAGRYLSDFMRYHRDMRRLEALNGGLDSVNLIGNAKLRDLSAVNGTLYEFLLADEQKPAEQKILRHVIIKADIRDSTRLTRSLTERGLNPASYFSLNFYDPVNKMLPKYGATKVFIEGDALILAILEREGDPPLAVSRASVLAREIIEIVDGYNTLLARSGLPPLELGIGISFQDSAPLYLMDGEQRIMISDALNESDRLSSCHKRVRKPMQRLESVFNVYAFTTAGEMDAAGSVDDFNLNYNLGGIRLSEAAFEHLQREISLEQCSLEYPELWGTEGFRLFSGLVSLGSGIFRRLVLRASRIAQVNTSDFSFVRWTERPYYEVCSNPAIYSALEGKSAKANS